MIDYFLINSTGFLGAILFLLLISKKTQNVITHAHIFSIVWGLMIIFSQQFLNGAIKPNYDTLIVLFLSWWSFLLGTLFLINKKHIAHIPMISSVSKIRSIVIILVLISLQWIAIIYEGTSSYIVSSNIPSLILDIANIRLSHYSDLNDLPWFLEIWRWSYIYYLPMMIMLIKQRKISNMFALIILIQALLTTVTRFTRAPLLQLIVISFYSWIKIYRPNLRNAINFGAVLVLLSGASFLYIQSTLVFLTSYSGHIIESIASYVAAPPIAFQSILTGHYPIVSKSLYTLDFLNFILFKLGEIQFYPSLIRMPYNGLVITNLYTFLDAYMIDFGIAGTLIGSFLTAALVTISYNSSEQHITVFSLTTYCYLIYCCVMTPANNEFIRISLPLVIINSFLFNVLVSIRKTSPHKKQIRFRSAQ